MAPKKKSPVDLLRERVATQAKQPALSPVELLRAKMSGKTVKVDARKMSEMELKRLQAQVKAQGVKVEFLGGHVKKHGPSLLSRTFDVLSRPSYMVNNFLLEGLQARKKGQGTLGQLGAAFSGGGKGITGKDKTSFSEYLGEQGVKNKWARTIGGLAGDIALDPTTYLTGGLSKVGEVGKVGKIAEELGVAGRSLDEAAKAGELISKAQLAGATRTAENVLKKASNPKLSSELAQIRTATHTEALAKGLTTKEAKEAAEQAVKGRIGEHLQTLSKRATPPGTVQLKVHLPGVGERVIAESKGLYTVGSKIGTKARESDLVDHVAKAFRTQAQFPGRLNEMRQIAKNVNAAEFEGDIYRIKHAFTGTTASERATITHALESGAVDTLPAHLVDKAKLARTELDEIAKNEAAKGLSRSKELMDNYVPHYYQNRREMRLLNVENSRLGGATLMGAKAKNLNPVEDIADILARRWGEYYHGAAQATFIDDAVKEFAIDATRAGVGKGRFKNLAEAGDLVPAESLGISRLPAGTYFDREVADALRTATERLSRPETTRYFLKQFDSIQRLWKFSVTAPNPGFHFRNLLSDSWMNAMDGVVTLRPYEKAMKAVAEKGSFKVKVGEHVIDGDRVKQLYDAMGLRSGFYHAEVGIVPKPGIRVLGGAKDVLQKGSEAREDFTRMAHFIDALEKEGRKLPKGMDAGKAAETAAQRAARRVQKFNFDYQDLTDFEKAFMKRIVPFYTWMRKNIPTQIELLATRPGRVAVAPKGMRAIEQLMGTDKEHREPLPGIQAIFPKWLEDQMPLMMRPGDEANDPLFAVPRLPFADLAQYGEGLQEGDWKQALVAQMNGLTPVVKAPIELATGKSLYTGADINNTGEYFLNQLPTGGRFITDAMAGEASAKQPVITLDIGGHKVKIGQRLANYLTGAGLQTVTPSMRKGELRRQQDPLQAKVSELLKKKRAELAKNAPSRKRH